MKTLVGRNKAYLCSFALLAFAGVQSAVAGPVAVTNPSFETLPGGGLPFSCGTACAFSNGTAIPGWTASNASSGQFQPGPPTNTSFFNSVTDGTTIAYMDATGTISQTVSGTISAAGLVYTLQVDVGKRKDLPTTGSVQLLIGSNPVSATGVTPTSGNWSTFTAVYTTVAADIGKTVTIQLSTTGGTQGDFDNVRLDATAQSSLPEPVSMVLLGSGLLALSVIGRKRMSRSQK